MGVHVILDIEPSGIDDSAWVAVYEETLALLEAWRPRLLGWGSRTVGGRRVGMYARSIRGNAANPGKECWTVVGDRESLHTAEAQSLYRDLAHYPRGEGRAVADDVVAAAAGPTRPDTGGPVCVFGDKTQGYPYHLAVLAAAMVVEERFPRRAMVWGDIDRAEAELARKMAAPILGRELPLPVRVDAATLIDRLRAAYDADGVAGAFERVHCGVLPPTTAVLEALGGPESAVAARLVEEVERQRHAELFLRLMQRASEAAGDDTHALATLADPDAMGTFQRECVRMTSWTVTQQQQRATLLDENEGKREVSRLLADHPLVLTEDAWDAVLAEHDLEVLHFWIALLRIPGFELRTSHVRRAIFENPAVRRYAMAVARDATEMRSVAALVDEARARRKPG
jgi:hypothetical protein